MNRKNLLSLAVATVNLIATSTVYSQGMEGGQSRSRLDSSRMPQHSRAADGLARREAERRRDERAQIMQDYRESREPGQEGRSDPED